MFINQSITVPTTVLKTEMTTASTLDEVMFYTEAWFIAVMCVGGVLVVAFFVVLVAKCCCHRTLPYGYSKDQVYSDTPLPWKPPPYHADQYSVDHPVSDYSVWLTHRLLYFVEKFSNNIRLVSHVTKYWNMRLPCWWALAVRWQVAYLPKLLAFPTQLMAVWPRYLRLAL